MSQFIGVDIGTTRTKAGCYDAGTGRLVALRHAPTVVEADPWGGRRDAGRLAGAVGALLGSLLADPAVRVADLAGVCVGSVGEEVVLLASDGSVTAPVPAWFAAHGQEAKAVLDDPHWAGTDETFSIFKLLWLAHRMPSELVAARTFTSLADFVARDLLADPAAPVFLNVSHSSRTGLLDVHRGVLVDVLPDLGLGTLALPDLVPSGTVVGRTSGGGVLPAGIPVVAGGHDHMCGAFGSGVRNAGDVYVSAGTSEAQVLLLDQIPATPTPGVDTGVFVTGGLRYLHRATPSGRYYQTWHDLLYPGVDDDTMWTEITPEAGKATPASIYPDHRRLHLPPLPIDVPRGHIMASLLKGLATEAENTTTRLSHLGATEIADITVAGVPATSPTWRDLRQQATPRHLRFVLEPEATVLGVALLAQLATTGHADTPATHLTGPRQEENAHDNP